MAWIIAVILFVAVWYSIANRWTVSWFPDERHFIPLPGDRHIVLHRLRPSPGPKRNHPVILCHGLGANRSNLAMPGSNNLAELLRGRGYDVFCLELSGHGMSVPENWRHPGRWECVFDDYVRRDCPAAIERVLAETGADQVFWVGHSMGGMVGYGLGQFETASKVRGLAAVASPGTFGHAKKLVRLWSLHPLAKVFPKISQDIYARLFAPIAGFLPRRPLRIIIDPANTDPDVLKHAAATVPSAVSTKLLLDFGRWIKFGSLASSSGYDYQANLGRFSLPVLFICSAGDRLAAPESVRFVFDRVGSPDKTYVHLSKAEGGKADYGHGDIIFGRTAPEEVFGPILEWIDARDAPAAIP